MYKTFVPHEASHKRILFLINPRSGGLKATKTILALKQYAQSVDNAVAVEELHRDYFLNKVPPSASADIVVIGGGDGTFSSLLPYLSGIQSPIGLLPLGTGNDLARELGLTPLLHLNDVAEIVKFYREGASQNVTYYTLEYGEGFSSKIPFINYVSFGFDAKVVAGFAKLRESGWWRTVRGVWGNRLGYAFIGLAHAMYQIVSHKAFALKNGQNTHTFHAAKSIIFANIRSIMGLGSSTPYSSIVDKNIECVVVNSLIQYLTMITHYKLPLFHPRVMGSAHAWEIADMPMGVPIQIDGEPRPDIQSSNFRISVGGTLSTIVSSKQH